jgi:hypothetical protein
MKAYIDIVFDGPPAHESGRFVEVEDAGKRSISIGEWIEDGGLWRLRIPDPRRCAELDAECHQRLAEMTAKRDALFEEATAKGREVARLRAALTELAALVRGECPSLLDEDSGGLGRLSVDIDAALQREGLAPKGEGR